MQACHAQWPSISIDDLDKVVAIIKEHNSKYKHKPVRDGTCLVDRLILGKCWLIKYDAKAKTKGTRVFWDKFLGKGNMDNQSSANSLSNRETASDMEVLATLSGFQYRESGKSYYVDMRKSDIASHLLSNVPQYIKNQDPTPSFTWSTTGTNTVFTVKVQTTLSWQCGYV